MRRRVGEWWLGLCAKHPAGKQGTFFATTTTIATTIITGVATATDFSITINVTAITTAIITVTITIVTEFPDTPEAERGLSLIGRKRSHSVARAHDERTKVLAYACKHMYRHVYGHADNCVHKQSN